MGFQLSVGLGRISPWLFLLPSGILIGVEWCDASDWADWKFEEVGWNGMPALLTAPLAALGEAAEDVEVAIVEGRFCLVDD